MTNRPVKNRVIFIDLIRAFAVLNMVQGHTIDALLNPEYRNFDSILYTIWHTNRGFTAPIFLFSFGAVFSYLFKLERKPFAENSRVIKGVKRAALLIFLGYLLRYPTPKIIFFDNVTDEQWKIFFSVDVLQLIGMGLLAIIALFYLSEKLFKNEYIVFGIAALISGFLYTIFEKIDWNSFLHPFFAGYFYHKTGSNFPLFPWLVYVFAGAMLGVYLSKRDLVFKSFKFSSRLFTIGAFLILFYYSVIYILPIFHIGSNPWKYYNGLVLFRLGVVVLLNAVFTLIALKIQTIPKIIILLGRNTLLIYVIHLIIIYGSAWNRGLNYFYERSLDPFLTISIALIMLGLMILIVYLLDWFNVKNKSMVAG